ncbi:MAG: hypothetical protein IJO06_02795 [Thermoguttaceae bacterium]|nr:hypothetical protein [Thermoguttaceae bacterium]
MPQTLAILPVSLDGAVASVPFEGTTVSGKPVSAFKALDFAVFVLIFVPLAPPFARRGIAGAPLETSAPITISPVGVRVERAAPFAGVRLRVAPFGVSSVVLFRAFLGQSHPFVFRSRLQSQGGRSDVKIRRSVKIGAETLRSTTGTLRQFANAPGERRARRFRSSN